jgi:hypothetical protein
VTTSAEAITRARNTDLLVSMFVVLFVWVSRSVVARCRPPDCASL